MTEKKNNFKVMEKLARFLARRDHSELELREKLGRTFHLDTVEKAIEAAYDRNWLVKPEELAEQVASVLHSKNKSQLYIQNYLRKKGLPEVVSEEIIELGKTRELLTNHYDHWSDEGTKQKAYRFLAHRGFTDQVIQKALYEKP